MLGTKVVLCVDRAAPTPWERQQKRRRSGRLEAKGNDVFTRVTAWLMDQARNGIFAYPPKRYIPEILPNFTGFRPTHSYHFCAYSSMTCVSVRFR
jgi:hypothetical protein